MKKILFILMSFLCMTVYAQVDSIQVKELNEVSVTSMYTTNTVQVGNVVDSETLKRENVGQEPSHIFRKMPSVFSTNDNGTDYGYGYFRIRGLDQTRINVNLDGCPWNEAEDFGTYFANSPDLMSSMRNIRVDRGASSTFNGIAGVAGGINLESIDIFRYNESSASAGYGSFNTWRGNMVYNMTPHCNWGLHIRASHSQTDGYRDYGSNNSNSVALKTGYKFNDNTQLTFLSLIGYHRNGQGWIGNTLSELASNPHANGNSKRDDDEFLTTMNVLQLKHYIRNDLLFTASAYYQMQNGSYRMDLDNYMMRMADPSWTIGTTNALYDYALRYHMIGGNAAFKYNFNHGNVTAGVNGYNYRRHHWLGNKSENVDESEYYDNTGNKTDFTAFAIAKYSPFKNFNVTGNVQYRYVNFDYWDNKNSEVKYDMHQQGTEWNFCNFGVGAEYLIVGKHKVYARFNYVNREPTRSTMFGGNEYATVVDNNVVLTTRTPEVARDVEVGYEYNSKRLQANLNLFYMNFKNELVLNGEYGLNGLPCHDNAKSSYRMGIEGVVNWNLYSNIWFNNNFSVSKNRVTTDTYNNVNHILSPSFTWNTDLMWKSQRWYADLNFNYRNSMYVDMENEHSIPAAWTINLSGAYRFKNNLELGLNLNNITNRVNYCTGAVGATGETLYFRNAGFNAMGSVKYYF